MYKLLRTPEDCNKQFSIISKQLAETIDLCDSTANSCILPNCMKLSRLQKLIPELRHHAHFIQSYDAYLHNNKLYDVQVIKLLKIANEAIKEYEDICTIIENSTCF
jgi:hypothetical protein